VVASTERCAKAGVRALVQIGSSPPWPGPQLGLGELAVENQGELVDHGVFPMLAVPADKRADELGAELRVPPVE